MPLFTSFAVCVYAHPGGPVETPGKRSRHFIYLRGPVVKKIQKLSEERGETFSQTVEHLAEEALERRSNDRLFNALYSFTRSSSILLDHLAIQMMGSDTTDEKDKKAALKKLESMHDEIDQVVLRDLKSFRDTE
jgi:hypothetical protein